MYSMQQLYFGFLQLALDCYSGDFFQNTCVKESNNMAI